MRTRLILSMSLALSMGCQAHLPTGTKARPTRAVATSDVQRLVSQSGISSEFAGKARLISDNGLGIISNNSGGLISDNGLGLISDNGLGIISNNSGGYRVLGTAPRQESLLADAKIEVLDAQGRLLVDAAKKPIVATTDKTGAYTFKAVLPKENLVLRIRLWNGGVLNAFLPYDEAGGRRTLDIGTASTLGTAYVLEKFVKKRKEVLDRLPAAEAEGLAKDMEAARALLTGKAPTYKPADLLKTAEDLKTKDTTLSERLDKIEAILLAGQANLGAGLDATQIALSFPVGVSGDESGRLYIIEAGSGRMRRVKADGTIETFVEQGLGIPHSMVRAKDGGYLLACPFVNKIIRVAPDGTTSDVAGSGSIGDIVADPKKSGLNKPESVAYGADGTLYIGESPKGFEARARLLAISPQGVMSEVDIEAVRKPKTVLSGIAGLADGTLYVADGNNSRLLKRAPGGAWEELPATFGQSEYARLLLDPQGRVLLADTGGNRIARLKADGSLETIAGTGQAGSDGDGGPATRATLNQPSGMYFDAKGTFYVVETGSSLVRAIDTAGTIRTVAGSQGVIAQGDALTIPVNSPTAMAFDAEGRLVISETSGNTVKRLEDGKLVVIAGTIKGYSGDGGPATAAKLDTPTGIAIGPKGELMVMDSSNYVARRVNPDGTIETVAGTGERGRTKLRSAPAKTQQLDRPTGVAFDLQGRPVWADNANHQILRLNPDGTLEVIVGKAPVDDEDGGDAGDGGPATEAALKLPLGVTYDSKGNLYICDTGNMRVRKVSPDGVITTVAGVPLASALGKLLGGLPKEEGIKATEAALVGPAAICVAPTGEIYFSESGTASLSALGDLSQLGALPIALPEIGARIRKIALDGTITTIAGQGGKVLTDKSGDNSLNRPIGLLIDAKGRLVICDAGNSQIKMLPKGSF